MKRLGSIYDLFCKVPCLACFRNIPISEDWERGLCSDQSYRQLLSLCHEIGHPGLTPPFLVYRFYLDPNGTGKTVKRNFHSRWDFFLQKTCFLVVVDYADTVSTYTDTTKTTWTSMVNFEGLSQTHQTLCEHFCPLKNKFF